MIFGKRWERQYQNRVEAATSAKAKWFENHTDPVFGRPPDTAYFNKDRITPDGKTYEVYQYKSPFRTSTLTKLEIDIWPPEEQKAVFLWLESKMDAISSLVPGLLLTSSEEDVGPGSYFYGITTPEQAAAAFDPKYIYAITLKGANPVRWVIHFNATIEQDVAGHIEGENEIIRSAYLFM